MIRRNFHDFLSLNHILQVRSNPIDDAIDEYAPCFGGCHGWCRIRLIVHCISTNIFGKKVERHRSLEFLRMSRQVLR